MKATEKAKEIDEVITSFTGKDRINTIENNKCISCGKNATKFRDALSQKEYTISGLCQECQDDVFGIN
jgi:hypothetical protein